MPFQSFQNINFTPPRGICYNQSAKNHPKMTLKNLYMWNRNNEAPSPFPNMIHL